jgi:hypothetical protein
MSKQPRAADVKVLELPTCLLYRWPLEPVGSRQPVLELRWTEDGEMVTSFTAHDERFVRRSDN